VLSKDERLKLNILSLRAYGVSSKWYTLFSRGCLLNAGVVLGQGKGGWRAGNQKTVVRLRKMGYFSIGVIRKIMQNRIKFLDLERERYNKLLKERYELQ
jgi:hypothetical protein